MSTPTPAPIRAGETVDVTIETMAHGGLGIGRLDGRVIFVRGAFPGDQVRARISKAKKRFAHAELAEILTPSALRVPQACPAAAAGAGCCDFGALDPAAELGLKTDITRDQLAKLGGVGELSEVTITATEVSPRRGWRTRTRLGVDEAGRAGVRRASSNELVTEVACSQVPPELLDGIVGPTARRFTPGAEIIAVLDSEGTRHVVESRKSGRGRRVERVVKVIEGKRDVAETVTFSGAPRTFVFDATAFWQAHRAAPQAYADRVTALLRGLSTAASEPVVWDLYSGVGLFAPAIAAALGEGTQIHAVDYSPAAMRGGTQPGLAGLNVHEHNTTVAKALAKGLAAPDAVVLDPPRSGAGSDVVAQIAAAGPSRVIHIGCDPATFARDVSAWQAAGYALRAAEVINAFPGTHHFEVIGLLEPAG